MPSDAGIAGGPPHLPNIHMGFGDLSSGLHAYTAISQEQEDLLHNKSLPRHAYWHSYSWAVMKDPRFF